MMLTTILSISETASENIMGTQFFWFYDVLLFAIVLGFIVACAKKGFISVAFGVISGLIAIILAYAISAPIADAVYDSMFEPKISGEINNSVSNTVSNVFPLNTSNIKYDEIVVNGQSLNSMIKTESKGLVSYDLTSVDLSKTGITKEQLFSLGMSQDTNIKNINAGTLTLSKDEADENKLGQWVFAKVISSNITTSWLQNLYNDITGIINNIVPGFITQSSPEGADALTKIIKSMTEAGTADLGAALSKNVIKPIMNVPIRALIILILFAILSIVFSFLAKAFRNVNKLPLIGPVNTVLGAVFGFVQAVIVIMLICVILQLTVSLTGNTIIFMNTQTIDKSIVFRYIYNFKLFNLLV